MLWGREFFWIGRSKTGLGEIRTYDRECGCLSSFPRIKIASLETPFLALKMPLRALIFGPRNRYYGGVQPARAARFVHVVVASRRGSDYPQNGEALLFLIDRRPRGWQELAFRVQSRKYAGERTQ